MVNQKPIKTSKLARLKAQAIAESARNRLKWENMVFDWQSKLFELAVQRETFVEAVGFCSFTNRDR